LVSYTPEADGRVNYVPVFNVDGRITAEGLIQRRDPRLRIALAALFALSCVSLQSLDRLGIMLGLALALALAARLPLGPTIRRMAAMEAFMAVVLLTLPFSIVGSEVFRLGPFVATWQGLGRAAEIILKANAVVLGVFALIGTLEAVTLGHALAALGLPRKLVHLLLLTVRYVSVLRDQYVQLRDAMRVRAFRARASVHGLGSLGWLVGMLMVRSNERASRIQAAMKCRGFKGEFHVLHEMHAGPADWLSAIVFVFVLGWIVL
jgi:cobalt/nickel transport system permease protein